jgi:hypothetical protein
MNIADLFPQYLKEADFWTSIWPMLVVPLLTSFLVSIFLIDRKKAAPNFKTMRAVTLACAFLGIVTGNVTGLSRDPVVGTVIPAVLGLVGGVFVYLVGTKGVERQHFVAGGIICLALNLIVGVYWGGRSRVLFDFNNRAYDASIAAATAASTQAAKRGTDLTDEDSRYAVALRRLLNEADFENMKANLEKQSNREFSTKYPQ